MVHARNKTIIHLTALGSLLLFFGGHMFAQQEEDPPSRVARLNYIQGNVSMEPAGVDEWAPAVVNRPFTVGDYLYADQGAQAELHLDVAVMRIGSQTNFGFLNLDDQTVQLKLTEGDMYIRVRNFGSDQTFEVDTPNAAVNLLRDGIYRFRVDANGDMSYVVVREGQAQVTGGGQAFTLNPGNSATLSGTDQLAYDIESAPAPDEFDRWSEQRDAHEARRVSSRYVAPTVIGYEDLDDYGSWQESQDYGAVWYPRDMDPGWAPYHNGHWAWIDPWGWTWVDDMPWGFAPFHYGRWAYIRNRWGWCPGPISPGYGGRYGRGYSRPYYAPAMVAWFGGSHWGVGVSIGGGGGPSLGWVPLGWGEVYTPAYHVSQRYFNNVNVSNTRIVNNVNITNVYNNVYVNKQVYNQRFVNARAPNAVMAMPQSAFASGRPVRQAAAPVRQADFARLRTASVIAPPVAPTRQALAPSAGARPAPRPAAQVVQRQVVARKTPPPAPVPFAARQAYLQQHAGQPLNVQAMRQATPSVRPVAANVRQAPPARPVAVQPGTRVGNPAVANPPAGPGQPAAQPNARPGQGTAQPQQPAVQNRPGQPAVQQPNRPGQPPQPAARPGQPTTGVSGPAQQPAPAAHGVPPNRQNNPQSPQNGRFTERTAPGGQPAQPNRPGAQPQVQERTQAPQAQHGVPPGRQQPQVEERTQPVPRPQPQVQERTQPPPQAQHGVPPGRQQPRVEERTQPVPRPQPQVQERTQPPPQTQHGVPPGRQQPQVEERTQPVPRPQPQVQERTQPPPQPQHGAPPSRQQPQVEERTQPVPRAQPQVQERTQPVPSARPQPANRPAEQARPEDRPAAAPHGTPPARQAPPAREERQKNGKDKRTG